MDEVRHIYMMDNDKAGGQREISEDFPGGLPFHVIPSVKYVSGDPDGSYRYDPQTAHTRAGDPSYQERIPESCGLCKAQELSAKATQIAEANS